MRLTNLSTQFIILSPPRLQQLLNLPQLSQIEQLRPDYARINDNGADVIAKCQNLTHLLELDLSRNITKLVEPDLSRNDALSIIGIRSITDSQYLSSLLKFTVAKPRNANQLELVKGIGSRDIIDF